MTALRLARLVLPPLVVGLREQRGRSRGHLGDRGNQGDHLALPVAVTVRDLVLGHADAADLVLGVRHECRRARGLQPVAVVWKC